MLFIGEKLEAAPVLSIKESKESRRSTSAQIFEGTG